MRQRIETKTGRRGTPRWAGRVTGVAVVALVGVGIAPGVASARPHNPTDTQIQQALTTQLTNVETKGTSPDAAFNDGLDAIKQITG